MKYLFLLLPLFAFGQSLPNPTPPSPTTLVMPREISPIMLIDPKTRASDFVQAYALVMKEKAGAKVIFKLMNGSELSNIMELTLMPGGSLILFKQSTTQGILYTFEKIENIDTLIVQ